jgi:6-phosphogluconolactonase
MSPLVTWNRRTFLSTASLAGAAALSPRPLVPEPHRTATPFLAFVGFSGPDSPATHRIETYRVYAGAWGRLHEVSCAAPRALVMHPKISVLYVAHCTGLHRNLPRGSVSAFTVDVSSGALLPLSCEPLALSATFPEHLAISPDGRTLHISAPRGGAYNILPLAANGAILAGLHALKQTGTGPHTLQANARPHAAIFHPSSLAAYASDLGSDRINHIAFSDGVPIIASRVSFTPGSGPGHIALHPSGKLLVVSNQLRPALTVLALDEKTGAVASTLQHFALDAALTGPLSFDPTGNYLYLTTSSHSTETSIITFRMEAGNLRATTTMRVPAIGHPGQLLVRERELLLAGEGGIACLALGSGGRLTGEPQHVVREDAASIAVL